VASAAGIAAGDGPNLISNHADMTVTATATAYAQGYAEDHGNAYIGSQTAPGVVANATGIPVGDGVNEIVNYGMLEVTASADADAFGRAHTTSVDAYGRAVANSFASSVGISTGDGGNSVANYGTITVSAEGSASARVDVYSTHEDEYRYTYASTDATSIGIETGGGNDTIANYGTISAEIIRNGAPSAGVGISSGGGNDEVTLAGDSLVAGSIDLGEDDDALRFGGNAQVAGHVTGGLGLDSVILADTGSFILSDVSGIEWFKVNEGKLEVGHDYQLVSEGGVVAQVNGDGSHGQLQIDGDFGLDGTLEVLRGPGAYLDGTTFDILSADLLSDVFDDEVLPLPTVLLGFETHQFSDLLEVEALVESFTTVATNPVEMTLAEYLDTILPGATGDLSLVLGEIQTLTEPGDFREAFSSLSPDSYDSSTRTTFHATRLYTEALQQRMNSLRYGSSAGGGQLQARLSPVLLAYNAPGGSAGQLLDAEQRAQAQKEPGAWIDVSGQWGDQDGEDGYTSFDYRTHGMTLGFDYPLTDGLVAGLSVDTANSDIDIEDGKGEGSVRGIGLSAYGSYFGEHAYIEAALSCADQRYMNERDVVVGSIQRTANSHHDGDLFSAFVGGGYDLRVKDWAVAPFGSLQYIHLEEDSFEETGAGSVNLSVDGRETESLVSEIGLRVGRVLERESGRLIPEFSAAWNYDFDIDDRSITASFAGSPGASFTIDGQDVEKHGATLGAGVTFIHNSGCRFSLKGSTEIRDDYNASGVGAEIRFTF